MEVSAKLYIKLILENFLFKYKNYQNDIIDKENNFI